MVLCFLSAASYPSLSSLYLHCMTTCSIFLLSVILPSLPACRGRETFLGLTHVNRSVLPMSLAALLPR